MGTRISQLPPKEANLSNTDLLMISESTTDGYATKSITGVEIIASARQGMQPTLESGTNIKTIEGNSLLGSGDIDLTKTDVGLSNVDNTSDASKPISTATQTALNAKQDLLVSGTNIKTINSTSLLGSGNVAVQDTLVSGTNIKTINGNSLLGSGDLVVGGGLTIGTTAITSGTVGRIVFQGTGNVVQQSANLFWDNTNSRFGIGTASPNMSLDIRTGNVGIGVTSDAGYKLDVNGTVRVATATAWQTVISTTNNGIIKAMGGYGNGDGTYGADGNLFLRAGVNGTIYITANNGNTAAFGLFGGSNGFNIGSGVSLLASAVFQLNSTTRGFLPPRMTNAQMVAIATPASGLMVYDTTNNKMCVYDGTAWQNLY